MQFDPNNKINKLCADGMNLEGEGKLEEASALFYQAWNEASNDVEKFTAAHYVARQQKSVADKLHWDRTALEFALKSKDENVEVTYPSLYLNIAKCYEDLEDFPNAEINYKLALSFAGLLPDEGYGKMIKSGIRSGLERIEGKSA